jgi:hypothetical protein
VDSHNLNCVSILLEYFRNIDAGSRLRVEVLSASFERIVDGLSSYSLQRIFLNALNRECFVDAGSEGHVVEENFSIVCLILIAKSIKFCFLKSEIQNREDTHELRSCNSSLAELVKVSEELFNSDALHDNHGTNTVFNIFGVVVSSHTGLHKSVVNDIEVLSWPVEAASLSNVLSLLVFGLRLWILSNVFRENIILVVDVSAEPIVVDFLSGSLIAVASSHKVEFLGSWGHESEGFQNTEELVGSHVLGFRSVKVTEAWFQVNSL